MPEASESGSVGAAEVARRIDRLYAGVRPTYLDEVFEQLALLGKLGVGVGVAVVADGVLYLGAITSPSTFASAVADAVEDATAQLGFDDASRRTIVDSLPKAEERLNEIIDERKKLVDRYPEDADIDDIAVEDAYDYFGAFRDRATVELHSVQVFVQGAPAMPVKHLCIRRSEISAWWPLKAQGVEVNYKANRTADEPS